MAIETADKVVVELEARLAQYSRDVTRGATAFDQSMKRMQDSATRTEKAVGSINGAMKSFLTIASARMLVGVAQRALEYASSLGEVAQQLGVSTKSLQVYRYAASQVGVSNDEMDAGLRKLTLTLGKARLGAEEPTKAFGALSKVLGQDILKSAKDTDAALPMIADALAKIPDPARRAAIEVELFGRAGQKLDTLLTGGSRGINELAAAAEKMGIVLSDEQIQRADETADKLSALKQVLEARIAGAVADNADAILALANALASVTGRLAQFWSQNPTQAFQTMGALAGAAAGARFGLPGAAVGGVAGLVAGTYMAPETPQSLRQHAAEQARTAQINAAGLGYVAGRRSRRDLEITRMPVVADALRRARDLRARAEKLERAGSYAVPKVPLVPDVGVPNFLSPTGAHKGKTGAGPSAEQLEKERLRAAYDFDREEMAGKRDLLQAQASLAVEYEDRADLARQMADLEFQQKARSIRFDLDMMLADKTISEAQKQEATNRADAATRAADHLRFLDQQKIVNDIALQRQRDSQALTDAQFNAERDLLQSQEGIATTAAERRKVELQLLDLSYQQRREALRHIQTDLLPNGDYSHSKAERDQAALNMGSLDATYGSARQGVLQSTRGPLEQWMASIPDTAAEMNEALENVAAQGLASLTDGLAQASASWIKMGGVAGDTLRMVYSELMKLVFSKGFSQLLALAGQAAGSFGGPVGSAGGIKNGAVIPGKASGGHITGGKLYRVNESGVEGFQPAGQGKIIPLGQMAQAGSGGGMTVVNQVTIHANDAVLAATVRDWVTQGMQQAAMQGAIGGQSLTMDRLRRQQRRRLA